MATSQTRMWCKTCGGYRLATKACPSHLLHLVLSVLTCGLWLLVWGVVFVVNAFRPYRCISCGGSTWQ